MPTDLRAAAVSLLLFTLLLGLAYPLAVTGAAHLLFPRRAEGSILYVDGRPAGSSLLGQRFSDPRYFWGRPSATAPVPYDGGSSAGSDLGPGNPELSTRVLERIDALRAADPGNLAPVPVDLVTASGSGLDPDISPAAAEFQVGRVAMARGLPPERVREVVAALTRGRQLGILGEPRVNVLALNRALDAAGGAPAQGRENL
jgi:potassium-transporting ATPase KdpC subunit